MILYNREDPLFSYWINKKKYERLIERNSLNFLKINTQNALSIKFNKNNIIKKFYFKKKEKKKLVLIIILDGILIIVKNLKFTNKFLVNHFLTPGQMLNGYHRTTI